MGPTAGAAVSRTNLVDDVLVTTRTSTIPSMSERFGKPISLDARTEALELLVETFGCAPLASDMAVNEAADFMERDFPDAAIRSLMTVCDLTGAYRAIAVMATR
jgi:hypothetical protein